jgi:hypothetical protein
MELIEVKKFNLGAKGETLYNLWKCDVNFRDPQILNPIHGEVYSIKHYVIQFVSDLRQIWISLGTPISATKVVTEIFLKVVLNT